MCQGASFSCGSYKFFSFKNPADSFSFGGQVPSELSAETVQGSIDLVLGLTV